MGIIGPRVWEICAYFILPRCSVRAVVYKLKKGCYPWDRSRTLMLTIVLWFPCSKGPEYKISCNSVHRSQRYGPFLVRIMCARLANIEFGALLGLASLQCDFVKCSICDYFFDVSVPHVDLFIVMHFTPGPVSYGMLTRFRPLAYFCRASLCSAAETLMHILLLRDSTFISIYWVLGFCTCRICELWAHPVQTC